ncbi:two-component sensor histidine kinase [Sphaerisporangium melleum]|uniref:histidine kinase n=1 Tax=Sphaerisporangium melleum TaxID=321316 RepID=A0A917R301_9ACTN|nr:HAMP domain-containing sensor histidine kinase [Sphaerisporangium melleum]GGK85533.1 two-component sensor histidine kinase [Sphaerisporangium melleum]GII71390.1 two-component sensor histidine kinase [Sphaerisporangium melleum]
MREVPLRHSLLVRLLAVSVLVSLCSIAATAWLTVRGTSVAISQEQGQALADDARVYDALLGYAGGHTSWEGAAAMVTRLARQVGHRITLTTEDRRPILDSDAGPVSLPTRPTAVIEPLAVDSALVAGAPSDRIDPRAVGPYRLPRREREQLRVAAEQRATCLRAVFGTPAEIVYGPSGRPRVEMHDLGLSLGSRCESLALDRPTPTEAKALGALTKLVNTCLGRQGAPEVRLGPDFTWTPPPGPAPGQDRAAAARAAVTTGRYVQECIAAGRREQLAPYVAPTALLFVGNRGTDASTIFDFSPASQARIAGVAALVLLITVTVTVLVGVRLVRPLRALTGAARRMEEGDVTARVGVTGRDEIARLAAAFNAMSARRERLEELRTAMVGDVAHELRTPLSNIRGWLEASEDGIVDPDRELVASLLEEALLLQHVVDDLQDLALADAGELRLRTERIDLADLLEQVATVHRGRAEAAGVTLTTRVPGEVWLTADPVRLRQAVGNLVSNAVRHTPPGGIVALRAHADGPDVVIEVADTGSGITPEDVPLVFERFWRADRSRSRRTGGSGLGLAIVRKLAEAHGGTVAAASVLGEGSVFTLTLPAHR